MDTNDSKIPSYLEFTTKTGGKYIFDGGTGTVFPITPLMREAIVMYRSHSAKEILNSLRTNYNASEVESVIDFVHRWHTIFGGLYRTEKSITNETYQMNTLSEHAIKQSIEDGMTYQLVINLTDNCTLACRYCYYSEAYLYTRNRTSDSLRVDVGVKALQLFFTMMASVAKRIPRKRVGITFYGGEPLMNYDTLKVLTRYIQERSPVPFSLHISTNGCLLNDEVADFLVDNGFYVAISLDGTKENHDRNRRTVNDRGSFDTVYTNIKRFQQRHPRYKRCSLLCVYDINTDLEANITFFEEETLPPILFLNTVLNIDTDYYKQFSVNDYNRFEQKYNELCERYYTYKSEGTYVPEYLRFLVEQDVLMLMLRIRREDARSFALPYTSTCIPGMKISVRTNGTFDICERVNGTMSIGDVDTGLNYSAIKRIINMYNSAITENCGTCALRMNCPLCFAFCNSKCGTFCHPSKFCNRFSEVFTERLHNVYSVLEKQPSAYDNCAALLPEEFVFFRS